VTFSPLPHSPLLVASRIHASPASQPLLQPSSPSFFIGQRMPSCGYPPAFLLIPPLSHATLSFSIAPVLHLVFSTIPSDCLRLAPPSRPRGSDPPFSFPRLFPTLSESLFRQSDLDRRFPAFSVYLGLFFPTLIGRNILRRAPIFCVFSPTSRSLFLSAESPSPLFSRYFPRSRLFPPDRIFLAFFSDICPLFPLTPRPSPSPVCRLLPDPVR